MTEKEQQYYDEVVSVLEKKGSVGFFERQKLTKLGASLGLAAGKILELDQKAKASRKSASVAGPAEEQRHREKREAVSVEQQQKLEVDRQKLDRVSVVPEDNDGTDDEDEETQSTDEVEQKPVKSDNSNFGCGLADVALICAVVAFWTGHWIIGVGVAIVALLLFIGSFSPRWSRTAVSSAR